MIALLGIALPGKAFSFALDSIADMGKFPRFCVKVYRMGDKFLNSYDTTYVKSPGLPFKVSTMSESWLTFYDFRFSENVNVNFISIPSTTIGLHLSWLAVSVGYDKNVSNLLGMNSKGQERWKFGFNSQRFAANFYYIKSDGGMRMTNFKAEGLSYPKDIFFDGGTSKQWQLSAFYFFNDKRYSHSAAFSYGKIQKRTAGSWFVGLAASNSAYHFDFSRLPDQLKLLIPLAHTDYKYNVNTHLWGAAGGYAINVNLGKGWIFGVMDSQIMGVRYGHNSTTNRRTRFGAENSLTGSFVYNHPRLRFYLGGIGELHTTMLIDHVHTLTNLFISMNFTAGYRF